MSLVGKLKDLIYSQENIKGTDVEEHSFNELKEWLEIIDKEYIDDKEQLKEIIKTYRFLSEHNYTTMAREDFDALLKELDSLRISKKDLVTSIKIIKTGEEKYDVKFEFNDSISETLAFELLNVALKDLKKNHNFTA